MNEKWYISFLFILSFIFDNLMAIFLISVFWLSPDKFYKPFEALRKVLCHHKYRSKQHKRCVPLLSSSQRCSVCLKDLMFSPSVLLNS